MKAPFLSPLAGLIPRAALLLAAAGICAYALGRIIGDQYERGVEFGDTRTALEYERQTREAQDAARAEEIAAEQRDNENRIIAEKKIAELQARLKKARAEALANEPDYAACDGVIVPVGLRLDAPGAAGDGSDS